MTENGSVLGHICGTSASTLRALLTHFLASVLRVEASKRQHKSFVFVLLSPFQYLALNDILKYKITITELFKFVFHFKVEATRLG